MFEVYKENAMKDYALAKKKVLVDLDILKELDKFNKLTDYYTTSSCSGRILLLRVNEKGEKMPEAFYYKTHDKTTTKEILKLVDNYDEKYDLWFKVEPFILHIGCRDIEGARTLLQFCKDLGIKRAGINAFSKRIIVEVIGTQYLDTPIVKAGEKLVSDDYISILVKTANVKLAKNKGILHDFFRKSKALNR
ncbi:tRNA(Phe) 7-((3-amino-3-carboxypropyl)-4-demethyl wyosine(37)-N(4))-methyltransferase [Candidatus Tiddalikarchaeum anstoanum]|nr:tRNA(Phe) 7-((3-amino-3-carboxypropyl)-4-demethyl wyosine(37)-N(4))-methyltransferase [Candidatus Tiddalikarchaeum anstoanum]